MTTSHASDLTTVVCLYRVQDGKTAEFRDLLARHWPALRDLGLTTTEPSVVYEGHDGDGPLFVEIFTWRDAAAPEQAHHLPEVMAVWGPMGALCEERPGRQPMEFPHIGRIPMPFDPR